MARSRDKNRPENMKKVETKKAAVRRQSTLATNGSATAGGFSVLLPSDHNGSDDSSKQTVARGRDTSVWEANSSHFGQSFASNKSATSKRRTMAIGELERLSLHESLAVQRPADSGSEESDAAEELPPTQSSGPLLGVVAFVECYSSADNRSFCIANELRQLGAAVSPTFTNRVTHVIFKDGRQSTIERARQKNVYVVSVLWVDSCKCNKTRMTESHFSVSNDGTPLIVGRTRKQKSMQPKPLDKELVMSAERIVKRQRRFDRVKQLRDLASYGPDSPIDVPTVNVSPDPLLQDIKSTPENKNSPFFTNNSNISWSPLPSTPDSMRMKLDNLREKIMKIANSSPLDSEINEGSPGWSQGVNEAISKRLFDSRGQIFGSPPPQPMTDQLLEPTGAGSTLFDLLADDDSDNETVSIAEEENVGRTPRSEWSFFVPQTQECDMEKPEEGFEVALEIPETVPPEFQNEAQEESEVGDSFVADPPARIELLDDDVVDKDPVKDAIGPQFLVPVTKRFLLSNRHLHRPLSHLPSPESSDVTPLSKKLTERTLQPADLPLIFRANSKTLQLADQQNLAGHKSPPKQPKGRKLRSSIFELKQSKTKGSSLNISSEEDDFKRYRSEKTVSRIKTAKPQTSELKKKWKRAEPCGRSIVLTSLHTPERESASRSIKRLGGFDVEDQVTARTTHVVLGEPRRTINVLFGLSYGCWVLSLDWLTSSEKTGTWSEEENFVMKDHFQAAEKNRLLKNRSEKNDLLASVGRIFVSEKCVPSATILKQLVELNGGVIATVPRNADLFVRYKSSLKTRPSVTEKWILDCISGGGLLPINDYLEESAS